MGIIVGYKTNTVRKNDKKRPGCPGQIGRSYVYLPILKTPVPHFGQVPFFAGLPFFIVMAFGAFISTFFLHFTQYAVTILVTKG